MKTRASLPFRASRAALRTSLCAAAMVGAAVVGTDAAATVVTFNTPINAPNTSSGIYINFATGATAASNGGFAGWDLDLYSPGNYGLGFFWNSVGAGAGVVDEHTGLYLDAADGTVISSNSLFSSNSAPYATAAFRTAGDHTLAFGFYNEAKEKKNYGYMRVTSAGSASGYPLTINSWSFEDNGGAITVPSSLSPVPVTAVPEPSTAVLSLGGLALLGAVGARRKRRASAA